MIVKFPKLNKYILDLFSIFVCIIFSPIIFGLFVGLLVERLSEWWEEDFGPWVGVNQNRFAWLPIKVYDEIDFPWPIATVWLEWVIKTKNIHGETVYIRRKNEQ